MELEIIFSMIFFSTFVIYSAFSIYVLNLNPKFIVNRLFFIVCLLFSVWSFGFSIANSAHNYESALFWRRIASIGWGTVYSFMLHFILALTGKNKILKRRWIYIFIYFPALVNIVVFSLWNEIASNQYNMVHTAAGWANIQINNGYDMFFNLYYISFFITIIFILIFWGKGTSDSKKLKQRKLLIGSFALSIIAGTITDIIANSYLEKAVPQMGPIVLLIPVSAIFYLIKKYGLMLPVVKSTEGQEGIILDDLNRRRLSKIITILFLAGTVLNFMSQYFIDGKDLSKTLFFSGILFFGGMIIQFIGRLKISRDSKDSIVGLIMIFSIFLVNIRFIEYAGTTVWAISFFVIIISVVFSQKKIIQWLSVLLIFVQVLVWLHSPNIVIEIGMADYIIRIVIICLAIWISFFINSIYIGKLEDNEKLIKFQKVQLKISAELNNIKELNMNNKIDSILMIIGQYEDVDCISFSVFENSNYDLKVLNEWNLEGINVNSKEIAFSVCPLIMDEILDNKIVLLPDFKMDCIKKGWCIDLANKTKIKSMTCIPILNDEKIIGVLSLEAIVSKKNWNNDSKKRFRILANYLMDARIRINAKKEINYLAYYDTLTGLPNRRCFKNQLEESVSLACRLQKVIAVIFLDLDSFKAVNDTIGHKGGDELLKEVASRLSASVRRYDVVSRFGGDEFLIMMPQISYLDDVKKLISQIMDVFTKPIVIDDHKFNITASAGVSIYPFDGEDVETLVKNADMAMYESKAKNKNQYTICSSDLKEDILMRMKLTDRLCRAVENNELMVYYQPQVNRVTNEIVGMEALARWMYPEIGMIPPSIFIPIAERTGLINTIGQWVLDTACRQNKIWQDSGLLAVPISVNLSVEQFRTLKLTQVVKNVLESTELESKYLELEITENIAIDKSMNVVKALDELKDIGVNIAIDDFGIEYSSLSRLKDLPIDRIKIDTQFVRGISKNRKDESIIEVIIFLAKRLGLSIIAEGVETEFQLNYLRDKGCHIIQGYYYYRPMNNNNLTLLLEERKNKENARIVASDKG